MKRFLTVCISTCAVLIIAAIAIYLWPSSLVGHWEMETILPIDARLEGMSVFVQNALLAEYETRALQEHMEIIFERDGTGWEISATLERTTRSEFKWRTDGTRLIIEPWVLGQLGPSIYREYEIAGFGGNKRLHLTDIDDNKGIVRVLRLVK
jgi:low affinity Fe/Cu permease